MNIMTIVVLAILVIFGVVGFRSGMVSRLEGILALAISAMLVSAALPVVTRVLREETPVYDIIRSHAESTISSLAVSKAADERILPDMPAPSGEEAQVLLNSLTRIQQTRLIQDLPVPDFLQKLMLSYNNSEGYRKLGVSSFGSYLVDFISNLILNIVAFLVTLLVVHVVVWGIFRVLNLAARLPLLRVVNRVGGLLVGLLEGVILVWVLFLVISMLSGTQVGVTLMGMIDDSVLLTPIYQGNLLMKLVTNAIAGMF